MKLGLKSGLSVLASVGFWYHTDTQWTIIELCLTPGTDSAKQINLVHVFFTFERNSYGPKSRINNSLKHSV